MSVYSYSVKHNGIFYKAGMEVPDDKPKKVEKPAEKSVVEKTEATKKPTTKTTTKKK